MTSSGLARTPQRQYRTPAKTAIQLEQAATERAQAQPLTTLCAHCDWTHDGTGETGRPAYLAHRLQAHPEIKPGPQRRRNNLRRPDRDTRPQQDTT